MHANAASAGDCSWHQWAAYGHYGQLACLHRDVALKQYQRCHHQVWGGIAGHLGNAPRSTAANDWGVGCREEAAMDVSMEGRKHGNRTSPETSWLLVPGRYCSSQYCLLSTLSCQEHASRWHRWLQNHTHTQYIYILHIYTCIFKAQTLHVGNIYLHLA